MKLSRTGWSAFLLQCLAVALPAATLTVTNTDDSGAGSLRQAILDSNASVGVLDTIAFDVPGAGTHTILVSSSLPDVTDPVVLDGTTQPGYAGSPLIEVQSNFAVNYGFHVTGGGSTIRGLVINEFSSLIVIDGNGGNHIEGCYIGTDANGAPKVTGGAYGITIFDTTGDVIGGATPAARNNISPASVGISAATTVGLVIQGNYFGTDVTGSVGSPFQGDAVQLGSAVGALVGGPAPEEGNVIASAGGSGIDVIGGSDVVIFGNRIGTDATGTKALRNETGVATSSFATDVQIGGPNPGEGNLISGNWVGVAPAYGVRVLGNRIGTDADGVQPLPNAYGVFVNGGGDVGIQIGGIEPGEGNVIAYNTGDQYGGGVSNEGGHRVAIRGNSIHANAGLGIDNDVDGPDANDLDDADSGSNDRQNFPIVTSVEILPGSQTRIQGVLHSRPSTAFAFDFYGNACSMRPQDFLEGETYLGSVDATTDGAGMAAFDVTLPVAIAAGDGVSATATDPDGNTSEFSQRLPFRVMPGGGPSGGGSPITVRGTDFELGATVSIGGVDATDVAVVSDIEITATSPALAPGTVHDLTIQNPGGTAGTLLSGWISDFLDVPQDHPFHAFVASLVRNGVAGGLGEGLYGVDASTLRQQMSVFLLKAKFGVCYAPPACTGVFSDVPCPSLFADWIEDLAAQGITGGCGAGLYCPQNPVRRDQMAAFLLKAKHGSAYEPPPCSQGFFVDVVCPSTFADWIQQLWIEGITGGCGGGNYCPQNPSTRGQMAVFLVKTFSLQ